jgi:hypothetical protein
MYGWREFVMARGLKSYGPNIADSYRQSDTTAVGTSRHFAAAQQFSRFRSEADIQRDANTESDL